MCFSYSKLTSQGYSLNLCYFAFFLTHRALNRYVLSRTNRGVLVESRLTALTEQATAWLTMRFLVSEAGVLEE
jgi:hypothetical protein